MLSGTQFCPPAPPALGSAEYATAFNEVKARGAVNSLIRTQEQAEIEYFWAYDRYDMGTPLRLYNQIAQTIAANQGNTLEENARLFALVNLAMADAGIVTWDAKYTYNFWRPITAIREADLEDIRLQRQIPTGHHLERQEEALFQDFTPPFPAYIAGHLALGAAAFGSWHNSLAFE